MNMRYDADKGDIPKHLVKGPTGIIHRSRCSRMLSMFLRGAPRNALGICWKCSTSCYMYIYYMYIYNYIYMYMLYVYIIYVIDIMGNRLTEGTSMYWRIKGHKDPLIYFVPAIGQSTLKCCPPSQPINMSTRIDDHPWSGKNKRLWKCMLLRGVSDFP